MVKCFTVYKVFSHKLPTVHLYVVRQSPVSFLTEGGRPRTNPLWFPLNSHPFHTCPENMFQSKPVYLIFQDYFPCVSFPYFHIELTEQFKVLRMVKLHEHERYFIHHFISSEDETILYEILCLLLFPGLKKRRLRLLRSQKSQHSSSSGRCLH